MQAGSLEFPRLSARAKIVPLCMRACALARSSRWTSLTPRVQSGRADSNFVSVVACWMNCGVRSLPSLSRQGSA